MQLSERVGFRCSLAEKLRIEQASDGNVSDYLRLLVLGKMDQHDSLDLILQKLQALTPPPKSPAAKGGGSDPLSQAILLELLLLMRAVAPLDRKSEAQAEVRRSGLEPWSYEAQAERGKS